MQELKYLKKEEINLNGQFEKTICFKPKFAPTICIVTGLLLLLVDNIGVRILGGFFILMALLVIILIKDFKVIDVYSDGILIFKDRIGDYCSFIKFDDISMWQVKYERGQDKIIIVLNDNSIIERISFQSNGIRKPLMKYMKEKEFNYLRTKHFNEKSLITSSFIKKIKSKIFNTK